MTGPDLTVLRQVLHDVCFPASRWQLIAEADWYGADIVTRDRLRGLPVRLYHDCADVTTELQGVIATRIRQRLGHRVGHGSPGRKTSKNTVSSHAAR